MGDEGEATKSAPSPGQVIFSNYLFAQLAKCSRRLNGQTDHAVWPA